METKNDVKVYTKTVCDYVEWLNRGIEFERTNTARDLSNRNKDIKKYNLVINLLDMVDKQTLLTVEGVRGSASRPFDMPNCGSLAECIANYYFDHMPKNEYSKHFRDDEIDLSMGCMPFEVKASLSANSKNTRANGDKPVLLINAVGIWFIKKADVKVLADDYGRFKYNVEYGKPCEWLMKKAGYEVEA